MLRASLRRWAESAARDAAASAQASEARAIRSEERMRQFVADASHELRTPLTTIRGFAELYRQGAVAALCLILRETVIKVDLEVVGLFLSDKRLLLGRPRDLIVSVREKELISQVRSSNFISMAIQDEIRNALKLSESATTLKQNLDASKLLYKLVLNETEKIYPVVIASMESFEKMKQECGTASAA